MPAPSITRVLTVKASSGRLSRVSLMTIRVGCIRRKVKRKRASQVIVRQVARIA